MSGPIQFKTTAALLAAWLLIPALCGAEVVARLTMRALGHQTTVRPGWLSKLLGWSLALLPRWGQVLVIAQVMKGMTAHQRTSTLPSSEQR